MAIVFQSESKKPVIITKAGDDPKKPTLFYFKVTDGIRRQVALNSLITGSNFGTKMAELFCMSLYRWDNLIDSKGKQIPFNAALRDVLVNETDVFTEDDVVEVLDFYGYLVKTKPEVEKKTQDKSTSTKVSKKQSDSDGRPENVKGVKATLNVIIPEGSA